MSLPVRLRAPAFETCARAVARRPGLFLFLVTCLLYGGAVRCGFTRWDDNHYVTENPLLQELSWSSVGAAVSEFRICNYHPITLLSYVPERALVGFDPWLYHLDNVLLHALAVVLAFRVGVRLLMDRGAAFLAALLFAVHPLRVESVAWVSERKGLLCAVFFLAALLVWLRGVDREVESKRQRLARHGSCFVLFVLACLSKALAVTFPAVMAVVLIYRRRWKKSSLVELAPYVAAAALFAGLGVAAQAEFGAVKELHGDSVALHALSVPKAIGFYAVKLVVPYRLSAMYSLEPASGLADPLVLLGLGLAVAASLLAALSLRRGRVAWLGIAFFVATWAPVSGIVPTTTLVADRYLYLPSLGLFWMLGAAAVALWRDRPERDWLLARAPLALTVAFVVICCPLTWSRVNVWESSETLWSDALLENPDSPVAHNQLASAHLRSGRFEEASTHAVRAIQLGFRRPRYLFNLARAYRGMGEGEKELACAQAILAGDPDFAPAALVVARHHLEANRVGEAARIVSGLSARLPDHPAVVATHGDIARLAGNPKGAFALYSRALELRPDSVQAAAGIAESLAAMGDRRGAEDCAREVLNAPSGALFPDCRKRLEAILRP